MAQPPQRATQVFVAYSYRLYPGPEYRQTYARAGDKCRVQFIYADTRITNEHILDKITKMIQESSFSIFDISDWNPNVTLELGIARGSGRPWYITIDPSKSTGGINEAPADLRGFDRIQYSTLSELEAGLIRLLTQQTVRESEAPTIIGASRERRPSEVPARDGVTVWDSTMKVPAREHGEFHVTIQKGSIVSVFAREIQGRPFDLYLIDRRNYVQFCKDGGGTKLVARTDEQVVEFRKKIPRDGTWYIVMDAFGKSNARRVALEVKIRPPEDDKELYPPMD